ncbi:MAG: radical SAM protein [Candidatus Omnitrophota bacterium]
MRIVLIIPPNPFLGDQKRNCPLGILYIAGVLEKEGYHTEAVDLRCLEEDKWLEKIPQADIYGITTSTPEYLIACRVAKLVKNKYSNACIVVGGVHPTVLPDRIDPVFDKVVVGEGERAILDVVNDCKNGVEKRFYQSPVIENLDDIPLPARHLLPPDSVISDKLVVPGIPATTIVTSRGCPFNCSFCSSPRMWGRRVRFRSADSVVAEIEKIKKDYGITHFRFQDDVMGANKKIFLEMFEKMQPLGIRWRANLHVNVSTTELLEAMKKAGCFEIHYGVETISQDVLDKNNRGMKLDVIYKAVENTKKLGLRVRLFFIIGLPFEEQGIADRTIEFIKKVGPDGVDLSTFIPFPGSDVFNNPSKYGIEILSKDFDDYYMSIGLYMGESEKDFICKHSNLSNDELKFERKKLLDFIEKYNLALNK